MPEFDGIMDGPQSQTLSADEFTKLSQAMSVGMPEETVTQAAEADETAQLQPQSEDADEQASPEGEPPVPDEVGALKKELSRVRALARQPKEENAFLREQVNRLQEQLDKRAAPPPVLVETPWTDERLIAQEIAWQEELSDAKIALSQAQSLGDAAAVNALAPRLSNARAQINAIKGELHKRTVETAKTHASQTLQQNDQVQEVAGMYEDLYKAFPELADRNSPLWRAGLEQYQSHPDLMSQLGSVADLVAVQLAISRNPQLVRGSTRAATEARRDIVTQLEAASNSRFVKGAGSANPSNRPPVNWSTVAQQPGGSEKFEAEMQRVMNG